MTLANSKVLKLVIGTSNPFKHANGNGVVFVCNATKRRQKPRYQVGLTPFLVMCSMRVASVLKDTAYHHLQ